MLCIRPVDDDDALEYAHLIGGETKESERGIVDIETLQQTNKQLIETLDELNKIRADGKAKRANAEQELGRIEGELRQKMLEINN